MAHFFSPRFPSPAVKGWEEKRGRGRGGREGISARNLWYSSLCCFCFFGGQGGGLGCFTLCPVSSPFGFIFSRVPMKVHDVFCPGKQQMRHFPNISFPKTEVSGSFFSSLTKNTALFSPKQGNSHGSLSSPFVHTQRIFQTRDMSHLTAHILLLYSPLNSLFFLPLFFWELW